MATLSPFPLSSGQQNHKLAAAPKLRGFLFIAILCIIVLSWDSSAVAVQAERMDSPTNNDTTTTTTTTCSALTNEDYDSSCSLSTGNIKMKASWSRQQQSPSRATPSSLEEITLNHPYYYYYNYNLSQLLHPLITSNNTTTNNNNVNVLRERVAAAMNPRGDSCPWLPQLPPQEEQDDDIHTNFDFYRLEDYYETASDGSGSLGKAQILEFGHEYEILQHVEKGRDYYNNVVLADERYEKVIDQCYNDAHYCSYWAAVLDMCESESPHRDYMAWHCPVACEACHELHIELKCPVDPHAKQAFYKNKGDLNRMFERIEYDPVFEIYEPRVLSRPSYAPGDDKYNANYDIGPWVIVLEQFLSDEEADHLVQLGHDLGYERSTDTGDLDESGEPTKVTTEDRTSTNTFCQDDCRKDPIVVTVMERMAFLTGIPARFSEDIQLLRYEEGQFYKVHHDYIDFEVNRMEGPRILTIFMYLNDVEQGGETRFDKMDLSITPKRGRVVIWPSVLDKNPSLPDYRTTHEALPVMKGLKYGANAWIHLRDYMLPREMGC